MISNDPTGVLSGGNVDNIEQLKITAYEPAFGIIGDIAKRNPKTRQSADHSMVYIVSTLLRKAFKNHEAIAKDHSIEELW
jgi:2-methylcitrate dehydratase